MTGPVFCLIRYTTLFNKCCPIKSKATSQKRFHCPWLTDFLLRSIETKHNSYLLSRHMLVIMMSAKGIVIIYAGP